MSRKVSWPSSLFSPFTLSPSLVINIVKNTKQEQTTFEDTIKLCTKRLIRGMKQIQDFLHLKTHARKLRRRMQGVKKKRDPLE